ncbi:hypothetical protein E2562_003629 [Oryza meyeriana var. granulata]|uniref:Uncharacterized protein n=1 Tax=Oryza meyeriana var. granulata TaxID=110450 RepID=A0A6G1CNI4_9ORYZ|nr:hypothetical protein E2562_003629 [Oryza meyeriana var. granulata]
MQTTKTADGVAAWCSRTQCGAHRTAADSLLTAAQRRHRGHWGNSTYETDANIRRRKIGAAWPAGGQE